MAALVITGMTFEINLTLEFCPFNVASEIKFGIEIESFNVKINYVNLSYK